jgi:hypothetical protein
MFTEESKYETKNPKDQSDWNKLTGLASYRFNSQKSSHMWAWRYYKGNFEIAPYSHNASGDKILPSEEEILIIPINTLFVVHIITTMPKHPAPNFVNMYAAYRGLDNKTVRLQLWPLLQLIPSNKYRVITTWFGGTSLPKKIVKIYG